MSDVLFLINPLSAEVIIGQSFTKGACFATLIDTLLGVQDYKIVKFPCTV